VRVPFQVYLARGHGEVAMVRAGCPFDKLEKVKAEKNPYARDAFLVQNFEFFPLDQDIHVKISIDSRVRK
jgi:hypothetical protein